MSPDLESRLAQEDYAIDEAWRASASVLRQLGGDPDRRRLIASSPLLISALRPAVRRFVAGWDQAAALEVAKDLSRSSVHVSIDYMGEDTVDDREVEDATTEFIELARACAKLGVGASISANLSHIGLAIDPSLASENCRRIAEEAKAHGIELILNMEGDRYRPHILDTFWNLGKRYPNLGITLQACLEDTVEDLARSLELQGRIRLVKGAYDELGEGAIRGGTVNARFSELCEQLVESGHRCSIATHDPELLSHTARLLKEKGSSELEFETLYGVALSRLEALRDAGHKVRVYMPYGTQWLLYLFHRLAEYPPNLHFAVQDVISNFVHEETQTQ